jgi:hypothetical protein
MGLIRKERKVDLFKTLNQSLSILQRFHYQAISAVEWIS